MPTGNVEQSEVLLLSLKIKTSDGKSFNLEGVDSNLTVFNLKRICAAEWGVAATHQHLFLKGSQLKDSETLNKAGLLDRSTLFLTKAPSWKTELEKAPAGTVPCAGGCGFYGTARRDNFCSKCFAKDQRDEWRDKLWKGIFAEESEEKEATVDKEEEAILGPLIVGAAVRIHGLGGAKELNGRLGWIVKYLEESCRYSVKLKGEQGTKAVKASNLRRLDNVTPLSASKVLVQKDTTRCWCCSRKCGLTGFTCRCGYVYCSKHRHAEDHECDFDHQAMGKDMLSKNNPKLQAKQWELLSGL